MPKDIIITHADNSASLPCGHATVLNSVAIVLINEGSAHIHKPTIDTPYRDDLNKKKVKPKAVKPVSKKKNSPNNSKK